MSASKSNVNDLSVFENNDKASTCNGNIDECVAFKRISKGMEYYSLFDILRNENDREIYRHFAKEVYQEILNDYVHIMRQHNHQIQEMQDSLMNSGKCKPCVLSKCKFTSRHYTPDNEENKENVLDPFLNLSKQTMDSLHFYLYHLFECGLRNRMSDDDVRMQKDGDEVDDAYVDAVFGRLIQRMDETRTTTDHFSRFKVGNKFNIEVDANDTNTNTGETDGKQSFFDEMFVYLVQIGVDDQDIEAFRDILHKDGYDTDALKYDLNTECNVLNKVKNKSIKKMLTAVEIHASAFSVGLRFYYWSYYSDIKQIPMEEQWHCNIDKHKGYDICDLFVIRKYASFKDEMGNYQHFCMKQYNEVVLVKVQAFKDTEIVKKTTRCEYDQFRKLHYDIEDGAILGEEHLCALILYTDFSELCAAFTRSFRKTSVFETLESIKDRNSNYWWLSKTLREAVECFGNCGIDKTLFGPFYTGMRNVMVIPEFTLRLCSPTSTSKHIEVAMQFSGRNGMIIQLNVEDGYVLCLLRGFDCSWFSRYPEEAERLFFGGDMYIKLESVRIIETKQNFHEFIGALYYLDSMLTGNPGVRRLKVNKENKTVIDTLFKWRIEQRKNENISEYIYQTFRGYLKNKKHIVVDLNVLDHYAKDKCMVNMIVHSLEKGDKRRDIEDKTNLLSEDIVQVFKDTESVEIMSTDSIGNYQYSLSINGLLCVFESSSWKRITVKAVRYKYKKDSWLSSLWKKDEAALKSDCEQRSVNIVFGKAHDSWQNEQHSLMFEKR